MKTLTPENLALAAFLHDIGKFWWPATNRKRPDDVNSWLDFLPHKNSHPTHLHAAYSAAFASRFVVNEPDSQFARIIASHHNPSTREEWIIAVADRLASGERRTGDSDTPVAEPEKSRITSPFHPKKEYLAIGRRSGWSKPDKKDLFHPTTDCRQDSGALNKAWNDFVSDIQDIGIPIRDSDIQQKGIPVRDMDTWLELLREHTTRVPAQSPTVMGNYQPSISIFDHSRMCAALAHVLAISDLKDEEIQGLAQASGHGATPFSLIVGDLSGIQSFLYTGSSAKAIRALKGRSFFLQYLTLRFSDLVREHFRLTPFATLYSGGGRFVL